jgi:hypothetical protein
MERQWVVSEAIQMEKQWADEAALGLGRDWLNSVDPDCSARSTGMWGRARLPSMGERMRKCGLHTNSDFIDPEARASSH